MADGCGSVDPEAIAGAGAAPAALAHVDGWPINVADRDELIDAVIADAEAGLGFSVATLNVDHLVKLRDDAGFRAAYRAARYVSADGAPVARLARRTDARIGLVTGADLLEPLARAAARRGLPIYLFGGARDGLERLADRLGGPGVVVGAQAPRFGFDPTGAEADAAIAAIRASGARLVFVLLGAPKQELFAARAVAAGVRAGFVGVGAAGDFLVGAKRRAPAWVRRLGYEAVWRFLQEPRRLGLRYARCAALLARLELESARRR